VRRHTYKLCELVVDVVVLRLLVHARDDDDPALDRCICGTDQTPRPPPSSPCSANSVLFRAPPPREIKGPRHRVPCRTSNVHRHGPLGSSTRSPSKVPVCIESSEDDGSRVPRPLTFLVRSPAADDEAAAVAARDCSSSSMPSNAISRSSNSILTSVSVSAISIVKELLHYSALETHTHWTHETHAQRLTRRLDG